MLRKCLWAFMLVGLFYSCDGNEDIPQPKPNETMTILSYLVANNNLDNYLLANIGAMYDGLAMMAEPAVLLVYWDGRTSVGENASKHLILKYETDGKGNINGSPALDFSYTLDDVLDEAIIVKEYAPQLSTDKEIMKLVLRDMVAQTCSEKLGLIVGSHASSWINSIFVSRSFGQDGSGTDNTILISDMVEALQSVGKRFEFILCDACYMGTVEVAYAFRDVTDYQIVSAMEVRAYGFPYDEFMTDLYQGSVDGYKRVCQTYVEYNKEQYESGGYAWGTVALVDSKEMQYMADCIRQEIVEHKDVLADYATDHLQEYGRRSAPHIAVDLGHLFKELNGGVLPASFSSQLDKAVLYKGCLENASPSYFNVDVANYSGLGMYVPVSARPEWNAYFKTIDWYTASGWNEVNFNWNF